MDLNRFLEKCGHLKTRTFPSYDRNCTERTVANADKLVDVVNLIMDLAKHIRNAESGNHRKAV